jgi:hypothetical protein
MIPSAFEVPPISSNSSYDETSLERRECGFSCVDPDDSPEQPFTHVPTLSELAESKIAAGEMITSLIDLESKKVITPAAVGAAAVRFPSGLVFGRKDGYSILDLSNLKNFVPAEYDKPMQKSEYR